MRIFDELMEHVLGNAQILIVMLLGVICVYSIYFYGVDGKELTSNIVSGLLGMAMAKSTNNSPVVKP